MVVQTANEFFNSLLDPVGYWQLNETNGTIAFDSSGYKNNGVYQLAVTLGVPGMPNPPFLLFPSNSLAASFDGGNHSWVTLTNLPVNSANMTIVAWIYPTNASALGTILWNSVTSSGLGGYYDGTSELDYNWNNDANAYNYQPELFPPLDEWSFVAMVITPSNAVFYMYNTTGQYSATNNVPNAAVNFTTGSVIGGVGSSNPDVSFNGSMADVAVFNDPLSSSQITQLYADAEGTPVLSAPSPSSAIIYAGGTVSFSVDVTGQTPISCLWQTNGVSINVSSLGTNTTSVLTISNVTAFDANSYYLVATNVYGAVTSAPASLMVYPLPPGSFAQSVLSNAPVAYWRFDELSGTTAYDYAGGHDAVFGAEAIYGLDGPCSPKWPGFETTNYAFEPLPGFGETTVTMPASEALNLNTNTVTMVAWVYFYEEGQSGGIVFQRGNGGVAGFGVGTNGDLEYNWNNDPVTTNWDSGLKLPLTQWAFVAWVVTPTNSTFYVYSADGQGSTTLVNTHTNSPFSGQIGIGCDPQGGDGEPIFNGIVDEVAIFDYSLSAAAIDLLYSAASAAPVPPFVLTVAPVTKGQFTLEFSGMNGQSYVVEMSTNLAAGNWTPVCTNVQSGGVFTYTDTNMADGARFYRVMQ